MKQQNLEMGLIGNCSIGVLVNEEAEINWACFPRFDGDPLFCSLLKTQSPEDIQGLWAIDLLNLASTEQWYAHNTAILITKLTDHDGNSVTVTDFTPRFDHYGRTYKPNTIIRKVTAEGTPRVRIRIRPVGKDGAEPLKKVQGSNHIRFVGEGANYRLTTNISVTALIDETAWVAGETVYMVFGGDEPLTESVQHFSEKMLVETRDYWQMWCRYLVISYEWQEAVIRAAITLKLSAYEDTGAIVAAMTTSIPEAECTTRNWDYRFCWLRDSYFTVHALNRLGVTRTMEQYLQYLVNIVATMEGDHLQPVFCINGTREMPERLVTSMQGYRGMGPVRIGNQAADQIQHDGYGAVILSVTQMFFDERILRRGDDKLFHMLEHIGECALAKYNQPDAGLWELRGNQYIHTFSSIMCWAGVDRLAKIAKKINQKSRANFWRKQANNIAEDIHKYGYNPELNAFTAAWRGDTMDASLLMAHELGFIKASDPKFIGTVEAIEKQLKPEGSRYLFRYIVEDDFGHPENAFTICSFWYIDALNAIGRKEEARELFVELLSKRNSLGLMSEDINPKTGELWGNFPQTYSMVGIINSARGLSIPWEEAF